MFEGPKNNNKEYEEYLERMKEEEVDPEAREEALRELAAGELADYAIPGKENSVENLNLKKMRESVADLSKIVEIMNSLQKDMGDSFEDIRRIRVLDLRNDEENLREPFDVVLNAIKNYEYDDYMSICDIGEETQKIISSLNEQIAALENSSSNK